MRKLFTLVTMTFILSVIVNFSNAQCIKTSCNGSSNTGTYSSAIGNQTNSTGNYAFSSGYKSAASGISTTALGDSSIAKGNFSFAAGCRSVTTKFKSVALGENCLTKEVQSYAFGQNCITNASQSLAIGRYMQTNASGAIALGSSTSQGPLVNGINNSLMIGFNSIVPTLFVGPSPDYKSSGNVGIGTTAPTQKLDIDGNIRLRNNAIIGTWSNNSLTFNTNSAARMVIAATGNVGIATSTPETQLHINGDITVSGLANEKGDQIVASDKTGKLLLVPVNALGDNLGNHTATESLNMMEFSIRNSTKAAKQSRLDGSQFYVGLKFSEVNNMILETGGAATFKAVAAANNIAGFWAANWACGGYGLLLNADNSTGGIYYDNNNPKLSIGLNNSKVGIGLIPPKDGTFRLYVEGGILAEEVKVMLKSTWPDYVFTTDHKLPGIHEVSDFIKANGHLPGVPSAATVAAEGIELGQMNALLLTKIEELTLYVIELKNENENIQRQLNELKK
jgi:hypothetical protein